MPFLIPLPTKSRPLPDAAPAVLDRNRRPTLDNSGVMREVGNLAESAKMPLLPADQLAAPFEALGAVGKALGQAGSVVGAAAIKEREVETFNQVRKADAALQIKESEEAAWRAANPDPSRWAEHYQATMGPLLHQLAADQNLHPAAREEIRLRVGTQINKGSAAVREGAAKKSNALASDAIQGSIGNAIESQNEADLNLWLEKGKGMGVLFDFHEAEYRRRFKDRGEQLQKQAKAEAYDVAANNALVFVDGYGEAAALTELERGTLGQFEPVEKERLAGVIRQAARVRSSEAMDALASGIVTGGINSEAAIDALQSPHLTPLLRERAKEELRRTDLAAEAEDRRANGVGNSVELLQKVREYDRAKDPDGRQYFALMAETKRRVNEDSDGAITGLLNQKFSAKPPPKLEPRQEVMKNLQETLADYFDAEKGAIPWKKKEWREVEARDGATGEKRKKWKEVETEDAAAKARARDAQTRVLSKLREWGELHPQEFQDLDKAKKKFLEFLPEGMRGGALELMQKKLRRAPQAAAGTVTSYGYANDSTPDSNSRAGIGAWVPDDEAAKIERGEPSEYRLRIGDIAVSPDVEKAFRTAGVKPGGAVMVQLANGEVRRARWMDRTAQDEDIASGRIRGVSKVLRGRFDFYSPGGKDAADGMAVVNWWRPESELTGK